MSLQSTCGGYVSSVRGLITSPGYPANYPGDADCEWVVRLRPATMITFSFLDLDIGAESDTECSQDYLVIRNGERPSSPFFLINPGQGNNQVDVYANIFRSGGYLELTMSRQSVSHVRLISKKSINSRVA